MSSGEDRDPLTGLPRAGTFQAALDARADVEAAPGGSPGFTVGLVDIVGLRHLNRDLGEAAGDELLRQIARRLVTSGAGQVVARVGPDEFALLAEHVQPGDGGQWMRWLHMRVLREPFVLGGKAVRVEFHRTHRAGPARAGRDLLWELQREALVDRGRELRQRQDGLERALAGAAGALQENERLRLDLEYVRDLANRDPATGLLNRRGMPERLQAMGAPFALAFVDLDNLRELNKKDDRWEAGDKAIAGLAERLQEAFGDDNVARWGGDEFLVVGSTSAGDMEAMLWRVLGECRRELIVGGSPITFSAGVAYCEDGDLDAVRRRAEEAVTVAKTIKATVRRFPE